jgi:hypothetical protein
MPTPIPEALAALDRHTAVQRFSDLRNLAVLYIVAAHLMIEAVALMVIWRSSGRIGFLLLAVLVLTLIFLIIRLGRKLRGAREQRRVSGAWEQALLERSERQLRPIILSVYLLAGAIVAVRWYFRPEDDPLLLLILLAAALRIAAIERMMIHLAILMGALVVIALRGGAGFSRADAPFWMPATVYLSVTLFAFLLGWWLTRRFSAAFLTAWLPAHRRLTEEHRMREELDLARTIQLSMLPRSMPEAEGLRLAAYSNPATEVGGDFYDFFPGDGRFGVVSADVAGHGVGSAIVLSGVRAALRLLSEELDEPQKLMTRLETLVRETRSGRMLVTVCLVSIAADRKSAAVISAGHPPVLHFRRAEGKVDIVMLPSLPLGTGMVQRFTPARLPLESGDRLLLHTDGVYETRNQKGEELGLDRLAALLGGGAPDESAADTVSRIAGELDSFRGSAEQEDDVTLVAIHVT